MNEQEIKEVVKLSICCNSDWISEGFVGLVDYGYTCNRCNKPCEIIDRVVIRKKRSHE